MNPIREYLDSQAQFLIGQLSQLQDPRKLSADQEADLGEIATCGQAFHSSCDECDGAERVQDELEGIVAALNRAEGAADIESLIGQCNALRSTIEAAEVGAEAD